MRSLRFRVLALVAGFGLTTAVLLASLMFRSVHEYYMDVVHEKSARFLERVIEMHPNLWETYRQDPQKFDERLRGYVLYSPNTSLYLLDDDGRVLASSDGEHPVPRDFRVDLSQARSAPDADSDAPTLAEDPDDRGHKYLVVARPLEPGGHTPGWLYLVARGSALTGDTPAIVRSYAIRTAIVVALVILSLGVLLTSMMMAVLTRPLIALTDVVRKVRDSGFSEALCGSMVPSCERTDEVGQLSRTFRDTFERLRLETERVQQTDARRREMIASVSHDLRTPLTALIGQLETIRIKGDSLDPAGQADLHERAMQNARHLHRLTDALADLARIDSPDFEAHPEPIAIGELADDVVQRFSARAREAGLELAIDYPDGLPLTRVDAALIERALANLLDNALRVTPRGGAVAVRVQRDGGGVRLEVTDTGPGISPEDQTKVFDRFYQASRHRELRGSSGLGLAIVKRVAELHGGSVGLDSQPGRGATFYIELPQPA